MGPKQPRSQQLWAHDNHVFITCSGELDVPSTPFNPHSKVSKGLREGTSLWPLGKTKKQESGVWWDSTGREPRGPPRSGEFKGAPYELRVVMPLACRVHLRVHSKGRSQLSSTGPPSSYYCPGLGRKSPVWLRPFPGIQTSYS